MNTPMMIAAAAHLAATLLAAGQIPTVQVDFHIADRRFQNELGTRLSTAEKIFLPILVGELEKRIGFLRFAKDAAPAGARRYRLVIHLGDAATGRGDVRFNLTMVSPAGAASGRPVSWQFRGLDEALKGLSRKQSVDDKIRDVDLVGGEGQPGELARKFAAGDFSRLVADLLSKVPMTADGATVTPGADPKWVLPLQRGEVCMDLHSRFRVAHLLEAADGSEELPLEVEATGPPDGATDALVGSIIARVPDMPDQTRSVGRLGSQGARVKITAVYIIQYLRRPVCTDALLPTEAITASGGGGQ